jgi:hypothetical protein
MVLAGCGSRSESSGSSSGDGKKVVKIGVIAPLSGGGIVKTCGSATHAA